MRGTRKVRSEGDWRGKLARGLKHSQTRRKVLLVGTLKHQRGKEDNDDEGVRGPLWNGARKRRRQNEYVKINKAS